MDRRVVTLWVINRDYDSVLLLSDYLNTVPRDAAQVVHVIKNLYYSPDGRFPTYEGSKAQEAVEGAGGQSIEFPVHGDSQQGTTIRQTRDDSPRIAACSNWRSGRDGVLG